MKSFKLIFIFLIFFVSNSMVFGQNSLQKDLFDLKNGTLEISVIGHGTLMLRYNDMIVHIDPVSREADYSLMPDADIILITHEHGDHLDAAAIGKILKSDTRVICNKSSASRIDNCTVLENGEKTELKGIMIEAVPAYNIRSKRSNGQPYHPKGNGNGYIIELGGRRIYIAGDTENIPEMKSFEDIYIAFIPMNLPYTMSPEMAAEAALMIKPEILYPYHFGSTDTGKLVELLKDTGIDVRIRDF